MSGTTIDRPGEIKRLPDDNRLNRIIEIADKKAAEVIRGTELGVSLTTPCEVIPPRGGEE